MKTQATTVTLALLLSIVWRADAFAAPGGLQTNVAVETRVLYEWLQVGDRYSSAACTANVEANNDQELAPSVVVTTTRTVAPGEVLFRLGHPAIWSAAAAYRDRDLGPKLRDYAQQAGPGFGTVALAGALAAEKVRRFRSREGLGVAPESAGFTVPSKWGAFARWLWWTSTDAHDDDKGENGLLYDIDESLTDAVSQGVKLLVPLLDVAARRYWSVDPADEPDTGVPDEQWTRMALVNDGAPRSWSRGELENVAMSSMALVLKQTRSPPNFFLEGIGSLIPKPFVDGKGDSPETWPSGESLAFVPLVDYIFSKKEENDDEPNAVIGSPPPRTKRHGENDCLWCIATRHLDAGERVIASNPWS